MKIQFGHRRREHWIKKELCVFSLWCGDIGCKKGERGVGLGCEGGGEAAWLKFAFCFVDSVNYHLRCRLWCEQVERIKYRTGVATLPVTCCIWLPCTPGPKPNYYRTTECASVLIASPVLMRCWGRALHFITLCSECSVRRTAHMHGFSVETGNSRFGFCW